MFHDVFGSFICFLIAGAGGQRSSSYHAVYQVRFQLLSWFKDILWVNGCLPGQSDIQSMFTLLASVECQPFLVSHLSAPCLHIKNSASGNWLAVDHRDGSLCTVDSSAPWAQRVFRLIQLSQPQDNSPLHFGDDVWISSNAGTHSMRWRNGRVIGTHTRTAHNMMTGVSDIGAPKGR